MISSFFPVNTSKKSSYHSTKNEVKLSVKEFFSKCKKTAVFCGFGHIYWKKILDGKFHFLRSAWYNFLVQVLVRNYYQKWPYLIKLNDSFYQQCLHPAYIYLFKVSYGNIKTMCEICSKLAIKAPERWQLSLLGVFIVNFEQISPTALSSHCWIWRSKCRWGRRNWWVILISDLQIDIEERNSDYDFDWAWQSTPKHA